MRGALMFLSNNNIAAAAAQLFREAGDKTSGGGRGRGSVRGGKPSMAEMAIAIHRS